MERKKKEEPKKPYETGHGFKPLTKKQLDMWTDYYIDDNGAKVKNEKAVKANKKK